MAITLRNRSASARAVTGAAFMAIENPTDQDDRLIAAHSDAAERVELLARSGEISKEMGKIEGEIHDLDVANGALQQQLAQVVATNRYR